MNEETIKKIKDGFNALPKIIQDFIFSDSYLQTLDEISSHYQLTIDQTNALEQETTITLMGMTNQEDFESELRNQSDIEPIKVSQISREVAEKIFAPIVEQLNQLTHSDIVQKLDDRFDKLPGNIKEMVEKSNYQTLLYEIAKTYKLSVTQMGSLDTVTTDLIIGAIHPDEFKNAIIKKIGLSEEESISLVNDVNEKVFKKIRGQLMALSTPEVTDQESETLREDLDTLKSNGIEITPIKTEEKSVWSSAVSKTNTEKKVVQEEKLEISSPDKPAIAPKEPKKLIASADVHPILAHKMSEVFQVPKVKTDYNLNNNSATPKVSSYQKNSDPYREIPE